MMNQKQVTLKPVEATDAEELFPMVYQSKVTDTIMWDGPKSLEDYRSGLADREIKTKEGTCHLFTIVDEETKRKLGSIDIRPYENSHRGDMGLWIGTQYQEQGFGFAAIRRILEYGFEKLKLEKIEAEIFIGNMASRRAFEKAGMQLEGTIRRAVKKRGQFLDVWLLGITKEEF